MILKNDSKFMGPLYSHMEDIRPLKSVTVDYRVRFKLYSSNKFVFWMNKVQK